MNYSLSDIASFTNGRIVGEPGEIIRRIYTDSRNLNTTDGTLFVAINGKKHDSHHFINDVAEKGITNFLVEYIPEIAVKDVNYVVVENTVNAFQQIAAKYRQTFNIPVIGITGSNGKTIVKEWLHYLLSNEFAIIRSPKSYNSQIGVPLSINLMQGNHSLAIFEAGISEPGEMSKLERVIKPTIGVFTNIGNAHQEYFSSYIEKVHEKFLLFKDSEIVVYCKDNEDVSGEANLLSHNIKKFSWSFHDEGANMLIVEQCVDDSSTIINYVCDGVRDSIKIPFTDKASVENAVTCLCVVHYLGKLSPSIKKRFEQLPQVAMRLELKEGRNNTTIINDFYNSDVESVKIALDFLNQQNQHPSKIVILSDIQQSGMSLEQLNDKIFSIIDEKHIDKFIGIGTDLFKCKELYRQRGDFYFTTDHFLQNIGKYTFENSSILLKGARSYQFERISSILVQQLHKTVLEVNLNALVNNLNYFKSLLKPETKIAVMVKAFSYGSGSVEIAHLLQHHRVDYLAVAFADEGVELRNAGVALPIMVMNPEPETFAKMIEFGLEPEIYSFRLLEMFTSELMLANIGEPYPVHIKFDTGMARMGFSRNEVTRLLDTLRGNIFVKVASVFSHLAGSDESQFDDFTREQISVFNETSKEMEAGLGYPMLKHLLNSAGIERFSYAQHNMVRLGIGLYGVSAVNSPQVQHISTLKTIISQVRKLEAGQTIGYSRKWTVTQPSSIAVIPIGYADGLNRRFSNGVGHVLVKGKKVPIVGNICMDATMIDITGVDAVEGDEVIIFNEQLTITEQATSIGTIPYEILTSVARRVKRVYLNE